jgi:hypothetical protein
MQTQDLFERHRQQIEEQQREFERGRVANTQRFERMWLSLGPDVIRAARSSHQPEIAEALGSAVRRWELLLNLEAQIPREEAHLAVLERGRIPDPADEYAPRELLAKKDAAHRATVESRRDQVKQMKEQAKRERKELESFVTKRR